MPQRTTRADKAGDIARWVQAGDVIAWRTAAGHSQADAARRIRVTQAAVSYWERGTTAPAGHKIDDYWKYLKTIRPTEN